jgi:DNA modification methylase
VSDWLDRTHLGDCRTLMRAMLADGVRVQCVVTSPPYWGLRDYGVLGQFGLERTWLRHVARMRGVFRLVRELLADDGVLWLNYGDSYAQAGGPGWQGKNGQRADRRFTCQRDSVALRKVGRTVPRGLKAKDLIGMPWRVAFALQVDGWYLRSDVIWHKTNPMPESITDRPTKAHEYVFLMAKSERYNYAASEISETAGPAGGKVRPNKGSSDPKMRTRSGLHESQARARANGGFETRNARTVWTIPTQPFSGAHFATFPEELVARCVLAGSRPGDVVFDPFMGSGTVAKVATDLGRRFIGCELNPEYLALARQTTVGLPI